MQAQHNLPTSRGFPLVEILIVMVAAGFLAVIILPQFSRVSSGPGPWYVLDLLSIRSQIELYNVQNPETRYDATTPVGPAFWEPLLMGNYLEAAPTNRLQNHSSLVVASPIEGAGWVWAEIPAGPVAGMYTIYMIDENGNFLDWDQDGWPD